MAGLPAFSGSTFKQFMTAPVAAKYHSTEQKVSESPCHFSLILMT